MSYRVRPFETRTCSHTHAPPLSLTHTGVRQGGGRGGFWVLKASFHSTFCEKGFFFFSQKVLEVFLWRRLSYWLISTAYPNWPGFFDNWKQWPLLAVSTRHHCLHDALGPGHGFGSWSRNDLELHWPAGGSRQVPRTLLPMGTTVVFSPDRAWGHGRAGGSRKTPDSLQQMIWASCGSSILMEHYQAMSRNKLWMK